MLLLFADIVAVVLYLEEEARKVTGFEQREYLVREIVVTDHRYDSYSI